MDVADYICACGRINAMDSRKCFMCVAMVRWESCGNIIVPGVRGKCLVEPRETVGYSILAGVHGVR